MKLACYTATRRPWYIGIGNVLVRMRLRSRISHCELVFEPGDGVDDLMPDGSLAPGAAQQYWCASSSSTDALPSWSKRRAGRSGGVRFKRIAARNGHWDLIDLPYADARYAANWFRAHEGALYDWQGVLGFVAWVVPHKSGRWTCSAACAAALGLAEPHRFDPATLAEVMRWRTVWG